MKVHNIVVCLGDSNTAGSDAASNTYPLYLQQLLGSNWRCVNWGVGNTQTSAHVTTWTNSIRNKYTNAAKKWLVYFGTPNDFAGQANDEAVQLTTANTAYTNVSGIFNNLVSDANWTGGIILTTTPADNYSGWGVHRQTGYDSYQSQILAYTGTGVQVVNGHDLLESQATPNRICSATGSSYSFNDYNGNAQSIARRDYSVKEGGGSADWLHINGNAHQDLATLLYHRINRAA
jgi:hypothetical protein